MTRRTLFFAALALSAAVPAFAQEAAPPAPAAVVAAADPAKDAKTDAKVDRFCLRETGTRIRPRATKAGEHGCRSIAAGRVYSRDDLRSTGQVDIADALRMLDPSIR